MRKADLELGRRHSPILSPDPRPWLGTCANRHPGCPGKSPHSPGLSRIKTLDRAERPRRPSRRSFRSAGSGWRLRRITSWMLPARTRPSDWRRRRSRHFTPWTTETECSAVFAAAFRSRTTPRSSISSAWAAPFVSPHLIQIDSEDSASCTSPVDICGLSPGFQTSWVDRSMPWASSRRECLRPVRCGRLAREWLRGSGHGHDSRPLARRGGVWGRELGEVLLHPGRSLPLSR